MRRLLELLHANLHWMLPVVCEAIALLLLFHGSLYHSFVGTAASSSVVGRIHSEGTRWRSYLSLQQENQQFTARLAPLEEHCLALQRQFEYLLADTVVPQMLTPLDSLDAIVREEPNFTSVTIRVISLTYLKINNMMIIDRDARDGIKPSMGVVFQNGVIGIMAQVGPRYAAVVPLINESLILSYVTLREGHVGDLSQRQRFPPEEGVMRGLPKHARLAVGDTLVTSDYSAIFSPGMMIDRLRGNGAQGTHVTYRKELPVLLATDFGQLHHVYVIIGGNTINLEEQASKEEL